MKGREQKQIYSPLLAQENQDFFAQDTHLQNKPLEKL